MATSPKSIGSATVATQNAWPAWRRWLQYQGERFPVLVYTPLLASMAFCALAVSATLAPAATVLGGLTWVLHGIAATLGLLGFFFLLRVADEFKDYETDCAHRPYRAVPRGLITKHELLYSAALVVFLQVLLSLMQGLHSVILLLLAYGWFALMSREFFVAHWLQQRPVLYLLSHMVMLPWLMAWSLSFYPAFNWIAWQAAGLLLLPLAFCQGLIIELGRKIRAPDQEEYGVETYSALWGPARAALIWSVVLSVTVLLAMGVVVALLQGWGRWLLLFVLGVGIMLPSWWFAWRMQREPNANSASVFEPWSGLSVLIIYSSAGSVIWW